MSTVNQSELYNQLYRELYNQSAAFRAGAFPDDPVARSIAKAIANVYGPAIAALEHRIDALESHAESHSGPHTAPAA